MRAREIILELREYLDRTKYGCWIYPDGKIEYVKDYGHVQYIMKVFNPEKAYTDLSIYNFAFKKGLVRFGVYKQTDLFINGNADDIKRVSHILIPSCVQPEIVEVIVDKEDVNKSKYFIMPRERREMIMFIKGESE